MLKRVILIVLSVVFGQHVDCTADSPCEISSVGRDDAGRYYTVVDTRGKISARIDADTDTLVGHASDYIVLLRDGRYRFLDVNGYCFRVDSISGMGRIDGVTDHSVTAEKNGWRISYDKYGCRISSRQLPGSQPLKGQ